MSTPKQDVLLLIRCPSCGQRFKVTEDLMQRTVECGNCEHRFRITEDVIVRGKKIYPGERSPMATNRFQRFQLASSSPSPQTVQYGKAPDPSQFEPTTPLQVVASLSGACIILLIGFILIVGAEQNAMLDGMTTDRRLIMASFAALLGGGLLVYGNRKARGKAMVGATLAGCALLSLPFLFQEGSVPLHATDQTSSTADLPEGASTAPAPTTPLDQLRQQIGTAPLDEEIKRLKSAQSPHTAIGLWLRNLRSSNRFLVRDFVIRTLGADQQTHFYPRDQDHYLLVVTGTDKALALIPDLVSPLGTVERIIDELAVVEITVDNNHFLVGPIEKLTNRDDPAFYELNKRELESIDLQRVSKAVRRLADAPPKIYQADVTKRLLLLLEADYVPFKSDVCRALQQWAKTEQQEAGHIALKVLGQIMTTTHRPPKEMIELAIASGSADVIPHIDHLWRESSGDWEYLYSQVGEKAEPSVLRSLSEVEGMQLHSAVRILEKIGTQASIAPLQQLASSAATTAELTVLIQRAITSIGSNHRE